MALFDAKKRIILESTCLGIALESTLSYYGEKNNDLKKFELLAQIEAAQKMYEKLLSVESSVNETKNAAIAASLAKSAAIAAAKVNKGASAPTPPAKIDIDISIAKGEYIALDTEANEATNDEAKPLTRSERAQQNRVK